jgi:hypothetical protein
LRLATFPSGSFSEYPWRLLCFGAPLCNFGSSRLDAHLSRFRN